MHERAQNYTWQCNDVNGWQKLLQNLGKVWKYTTIHVFYHLSCVVQNWLTYKADQGNFAVIQIYEDNLKREWIIMTVKDCKYVGGLTGFSDDHSIIKSQFLIVTIHSINNQVTRA